MSIIYIVLFIIIAFFILFYIYCDKIDGYINNIENFEDMFQDHEKYEEIYDEEFVNFYEIIYRDFMDIDYDTKIVFDKIVEPVKNKDDLNILVAGCGVGKLCKKIKDSYKNVCGIDISENMLLKAQTSYPNIKFIKGNLIKNDIFKKETFSHIYIDERTLYYNNEKDMNHIIKNSFDWLKEKGFLIVQVYVPEKLQVACRYYSSNYADNKGNIHGFTYLNDFSHDCYYIKNEDNEGNKENKENKEYKEYKENKESVDNDLIYDYYDKIVLKDGSKRIKKTRFYFPPKEKTYDIILSNGFELFYLEKIRTQIVGGYELAIFRKKRTKISVDELEKNKNI